MRVRHLLACTTLVGGVLVAPAATAAAPRFVGDDTQVSGSHSMTPAAGKKHQRGSFFEPPTPYHDTGTFDPECEDVDASVAFDYKGVFSTRNVRGSDGQAFFAKDKFRFTETWSEASTGKVLFTQRGAYWIEEVAAKRVKKSRVPHDLVPPEGLIGPIYRFTVVEEGHDKLFDGKGKTLYRTAGVVIYKQLFDTLGDRQPGGTSLKFEPVKVKGPHPLLDVDLCDVAAKQAHRKHR